MRYLYYPGCSLKCSGKGYEESLIPSFQALDVQLDELPDWNCCGATAYMSVDQDAALSLALRNLALAQRHGEAGDHPVDLIAPCAGCYLALHKAQHFVAEHAEAAAPALERLARAGLGTGATVRVRHPLDVLVEDVGLARVHARVTQPLGGMRVACYYGCQLVRPYAVFDDPDRPSTMDRLMAALGADPVEWPLRTRCCGGTLTGTIPQVGVRLSELLLQEAARRGAAAVATACPLCQFNLDCNPRHAADGGGHRPLPVLYFTQLLGLAFGIPRRRLGLERLLVPLRSAAAVAAGGPHD